MITLTREKGNRMWGGGNGSQFVGGGGGSSLAGYATESWVEENYLSKNFFNQLFVIHGTTTTTVKDSGGNIISGPTTVASIFSPNTMPSTTETTDSQTGNVTIVTTAITDIEAKKGLWTNFYMSALGLNSGGGGGGGATSLADLTDVNISYPNNGEALIYNAATGKWENQEIQAGGGSVTLINTGTGLTGGPINSTGTISIDQTYLTYIGHGETAYGWGNHANAGYWGSRSHPSTLAGYGINNAYTKAECDAKYLTIAAFENLFNAMASDGTTKIDAPYASSVASIKALFGLWTDQYMSALGLNSGGGGGGGGGATALTDLVDVSINDLDNGQILQYNSTSGKWQNVNGITASTTWWGRTVSGGAVSGDLDNVGRVNMGNNMSIRLRANGGDEQLWNAMVLNTSNTLAIGYGLRLHNSPTDIQGGTISFAVNGGSGSASSSSDNRVNAMTIDANGRVYIQQAAQGLRIGNGLLTWDSTNNAFKVSRISGSSEVAGDIYATGGVSALGMSAGASAIDAMTFGHIHVTSEITVDDEITVANKINLGSGGAYLLVDGSTLKFYDGTTMRTITTS